MRYQFSSIIITTSLFDVRLENVICQNCHLFVSFECLRVVESWAHKNDFWEVLNRTMKSLKIFDDFGGCRCVIGYGPMSQRFIHENTNDGRWCQLIDLWRVRNSFQRKLIHYIRSRLTCPLVSFLQSRCAALQVNRDLNQIENWNVTLVVTEQIYHNFLTASLAPGTFRPSLDFYQSFDSNHKCVNTEHTPNSSPDWQWQLHALIFVTISIRFETFLFSFSVINLNAGFSHSKMTLKYVRVMRRLSYLLAGRAQQNSFHFIEMERKRQQKTKRRKMAINCAKHKPTITWHCIASTNIQYSLRFVRCILISSSFSAKSSQAKVVGCCGTDQNQWGRRHPINERLNDRRRKKKIVGIVELNDQLTIYLVLMNLEPRQFANPRNERQSLSDKHKMEFSCRIIRDIP